MVPVIVVLVILLILLLPISVWTQYSENGPEVSLAAGAVKWKVYPREKRKAKPEKKKKKAPEEKPEKKGGKMKAFRGWLDVIKSFAGKLKRRLTVRRLVIHYTAAADNAASAALAYGGANAAVAGILPLLEDQFKIKRRDIRIDIDFEAKEQTIYAQLVISLAIWEILYLTVYLLHRIIRSGVLKREETTDREQEACQTEADAAPGT